MKTILIALACVPVVGCASVPGLGQDNGSSAFLDAMKAIASDPRCAHVDRIQGNLGGLGGNNLSVFLERTCPAAQAVPLSEYGKDVPAQPGE